MSLLDHEDLRRDVGPGRRRLRSCWRHMRLFCWRESEETAEGGVLGAQGVYAEYERQYRGVRMVLRRSLRPFAILAQELILVLIIL
jgi:hypothetical protein